MLSMTTDYNMTDTGDPSPSLKHIAEAGFSHVHWCHQWNTDFLYARCEIDQIAAWLKEYNLAMLDLHGSMGVEKNWSVAEPYRRRAGVELVANRLEMTARLGGRAVVMHGGRGPREMLRRSLDELVPIARSLGVRIAMENGDWPLLQDILPDYPADSVGLCYDSGHGNLQPGALDLLAAFKDRLIAVHLHDNDGLADQHRLPFTGTVNWPVLATIFGSSAYTGCLTLESSRRYEPVDNEAEFLAQAFLRGNRFSAMVSEARGRPG